MPRVVNGNLVARDAPKVIARLNANSSGTATFTLEPAGEVEFVEIEGHISFLREKAQQPLHIILPAVSFDFSLPPLNQVRISQVQWKERVSKYFSDEQLFISSKLAEETLAETSKVLRGLGLAYITRYKAEDGFAAERRDFFGVDAKGHGFGARILWRWPLSKDSTPTMLVRVFAETEEGLFSFCHRFMHRLQRGLMPLEEGDEENPEVGQPLV